MQQFLTNDTSVYLIQTSQNTVSVWGRPPSYILSRPTECTHISLYDIVIFDTYILTSSYFEK